MSDWLQKGVESLRLTEQPLAYLAQESARPDNPYAPAATAEIARRVAQAQIDAARYMKWSLVAVAITAGITAIASVGAWLLPHPFG